MKIQKIFLEHECCPIRWFAELEDGSMITIRERMNECVAYKGVKSIFDVNEEDVLVHFESELTQDEKLLEIFLEKLDAELLPGATDYLDQNFDKYMENKEGK